MKTLIFVTALLLVLSSCKKDCPIPNSDPGTVYTPDDPYSDPTYNPDPDPDPDPYSDPSDPGDPSDPDDPSDPSDPGDGSSGCSTKHTGHTVQYGKATSFNAGGQTNRASGK